MRRGVSRVLILVATLLVMLAILRHLAPILVVDARHVSLALASAGLVCAVGGHLLARAADRSLE